MSGYLNARSEYVTMLTWLFDQSLPLWGSLGTDFASGGFHEKISLDGSILEVPKRTRVTGRQIYSFATGGQLGWDGPWRELVEHGWSFMRASCFLADGCVKSAVDPIGVNHKLNFDLYDHAFALFGLCSVASGLPHSADEASDLALKCLNQMKAGWKHAAAGFHECQPYRTPLCSNPHMHLLEACLAWRGQTSAATQAEWDNLADEIVNLAISHFIGANGAVREFFDLDWNPMPGVNGRIIEPGHQFEWAWLLIRWGKLRGRKDALAIARRLVSIGESAGIGSGGDTYNALLDDLTVHDAGSRLWQQTERIKAWLAVSEIATTPDLRDQAMQKVADAARALMTFLDSAPPGLWRDRKNSEGTFIDEPSPASSLYHIVCAIAEMDRCFRRPNGLRKAVFLDRDGVINKDTGYVRDPELVELIPGAAQAISYLKSRNYLVFIVTNQSGIGRGYYDVDDYVLVQSKIAQLIEEAGGSIDATRFCPFHPDAKIEELRIDHSWRKPNPGMIIDIVDQWPVRVSESILIGDKDTDMRAAAGAGVSGFLFTGGDLCEFVKSIGL